MCGGLVLCSVCVLLHVSWMCSLPPHTRPILDNTYTYASLTRWVVCTVQCVCGSGACPVGPCEAEGGGWCGARGAHPQRPTLALWFLVWFCVRVVGLLFFGGSLCVQPPAASALGVCPARAELLFFRKRRRRSPAGGAFSQTYLSWRSSLNSLSFPRHSSIRLLNHTLVV